MREITNFNGVIDYIEAHLTDGIRVEDLAKMTLTSVYEFRRIFSFVAGISVSEYIRRRKLSAAAEDLRNGKETVTEIALKYGYDTPSSFSRAFKEFHGISPTELSKGAAAARHFTRISFDLQVRGGREICCEIRDEESFSLRGYTGRSDWQDTECCEAVWAGFYESAAAQDIPGDGKIYAAYRNGTDWVDCTIGVRTEEGDLTIPACRWARFPLNRTDDEYVNEFYKTVLYDWSVSAGYRRKEGVPNLEVYPADMEADGFLWEIWIPLERN